MGWNSFDGFGVYLHEAAAWNCLDAMSAKLAPYGYEYFVIDGGWHGEFKRQPGTRYPAEKHASELHLDRHGLPEPSRTSFPRGFAALIGETHARGLRFGLHLMRGVPRQAVQDGCRLRGSGVPLAEFALPERTCRWCDYNLGVDVCHSGGRQYYRDLIGKLVDWGVDFLKFDDITHFPDEIEAVMDAVEAVRPDLVVSLSPGGGIDTDQLAVYGRADMLRVTPDIWDDQASIDRGFEAMSRWQGVELERCRIDLDMIPFGALMQMTPSTGDNGSADENAYAGKGGARICGFTSSQKRTFLVQRAILASPLMVGGDPAHFDREDLALLGDRDIIACNQNGVTGREIDFAGQVSAYHAVDRRMAGSGWVGLFNRDPARSHRVRLTDLGIPSTPAVRWRSSDATPTATWTGGSAAQETDLSLPPGDAVLLRYTPPTPIKGSPVEMG